MEYVIQRNGNFYYNRRVPLEYREFDKREIVRLALKTDSPKDAIRLVRAKNHQMEAFWQSLAKTGQKVVHATYQQNIENASLHGFSYMPCIDVSKLPIDELLARVLLAKQKLLNEQDVSSLLGGVPIPQIKLDEFLPKYFHYMKDQALDKSENQKRKWRNPKRLAMNTFIALVGNKEAKQLTKADMLKYRDWWIDRIECEGLSRATANKNIIQIKTVIETVNESMNLDMDTLRLFSKVTLKNSDEKKRPSFETDYLLSTFLNPENLAGLNDQAKNVLYAFAETGAGVSELIGLTQKDIVLDCEIPHIIIRPDKDRTLKTKYRKRNIPLVGFALDAFKKYPNGFTDYTGRPDSLSGYLSKYLSENNLFPTEQHTVYSLRHSFQDRLLAANAPDRVQADLMGHKFPRQAYGSGASLEQKAEWMEKIKIRID